ncbi:MAG: HD domain-containing protein [Candidatus Hydrogenedentota bacterium]
MPYSKRVQEAFDYAFDLHRNQERKGNGVPYITHLMAVAAMVGEYGGDDNQVMGALLHDAAEDQGGQAVLDAVRERFGDTVAQYVADMSDSLADTRTEQKAAWHTRKQQYVAKLSQKPPALRLIAAADKLHNARCTARDLRQHGKQVWERFNAGPKDTLWYYHALYDGLAQGWDHPILDEFARAIDELEEANNR